MIYSFKCNKCKAIREIEAPISLGPPKNVVCDICEEEMHRLWGSAIHIPEYMRAAAGGDEHTSITQHMKHASRPTGRKKIFY